MKYEIGRMGMADGIALAFIITVPPIFLVTPAANVEKVGSLAWATTIALALVMPTVICLLARVYTRLKGDLIAMAEQLLGGLAAKFICLYYLIMFFSLAVLWAREFAEDTLITALPRAEFNFVVLWYILAVVVTAYMGLEVIARATYLIMPFIIGGIIIVLLALYPFYEFKYLFPWQGHGLKSLALQSISLIGGGAGSIILIIFAPSFQNERTIKKGAIFGIISSAALRGFSMLIFIMVFGPRLAMEKTLPFYEMARLVYFNRYVQRIESLFIIVWVAVGIIAITVCFFTGLYLLARLADLPTIRPLIPAMAVIISQLVIIPPDVTTAVNIIVKLYTFYNIVGVVIIPGVILLTAMVKGRRKTACTGK